MKKLRMYLIVSCLGIISNSQAYEWNQLTEIGVINKTAVEKNKKVDNVLDFSNLEIKKRTLSNDETKKKFPTLSDPKTIVLLGDTGCRLKESAGGSEYQDCNDKNAWPFWRIVEEASKENPDLIIHLGDYHYREKCSAGKPCEKMSAVVGYGWRPWELDFFQPMQKLFAKAPIVIVRGNHEDCNRAYRGYKSLLANYEWEKECVDYEPAQIIILDDFAIINFDSSSISEIPSENDEALWVKRFNEINEKVIKLKLKNVWMITHKPIYGIIPFKSALVPGNVNLRNYFEKSQLKDKVSVILGGHIHTSMIVTPKKISKQIILGNSGTQLDTFKVKITQSILDSFSYESAEMIDTGFGYAVLKKTNSHSSKIIFKDANGKETFSKSLSF